MTRKARSGYFAEGITLEVTPEGRAWARAVTEAVMASGATEKHVTTWWNAYEVNLFGRYAEHGFASWLGLADLLPSPAQAISQPNDGGQDLPGIGIKCALWQQAAHMFTCQGGRLIVPTRLMTADLYVRCSWFSQGQLLIFDGWATADMIKAAPLLTSNQGKPARELPFSALLLPRAFVTERELTPWA